MKPLTFTVLVAAALILISSSFARTWTQASSGNTIVADFAGVEGANVQLKAKGRIYSVPIASLSADDQAFIKEQMAAAASSSSADWPQWRGALQDGVSPDSDLLKEWPANGPEKVWTFSDAGMGYGGPSIAAGKLFVMGTRDSGLVVIAVDLTTGEEAWSTKVGSDETDTYNVGWGNGPRSTPTFNDGKVYALGPEGTLVCLDASDGSKIWSKNLVSDFRGRDGNWGYSESPVVDGEKVVVTPGGNDSPMIALDRNSGRTIWEADISGAGSAEYATVVIAETSSGKQYVKLFQSFVVGVDADSGREVWRSEWAGRTAVIPTPLVDGDEVYVCSGYGVGCMKLKIEGGAANQIWINKNMKNKHGGVIKFGDHVYGFSEAAGLVCQSWETGELAWNERGLQSSFGSIAIADGMIYCLNEGDGMVTLAEATPAGFNQKGQFKMEPQSTNRHNQGRIWTPPVVVGGKLYLRDQEHVSCYDVKK
ncbi:MAG: PQQ-binding-like beta-propeller repeat protein [Verrucomicrobiota bacterium]